ncbi:MAG: ATP phosphoribosyltransferase [Dehalococcoidia bacterium]|nr:ATP phosphoribosyltransferase [Dehalococcoidia bacterium]
MHDPCMSFMRACGLSVSRANSRRYIAEVRSVPGVTVMFQRGSDITAKVDDGAVDLGIVGKDQFLETRREDGDSRVVVDGLGFGRSNLVMAVPDAWVDVTSMSDLAEVSEEFRDMGQDLRVATKYPRLIQRHLLAHGVNYFSLVQSSGTLEAAPAMGFADIIGDITETGSTIRENRLKQIEGGTAISSDACVISRKMDPVRDTAQLAAARLLLEMMEANLGARTVVRITANMKGETAEEVAEYVLRHSDISGLQGPTISKVYAPDGTGWFAVTVIIEESRLLSAVDTIREIGGTSVTVDKPSYVFQSESTSYSRLVQAV